MRFKSYNTVLEKKREVKDPCTLRCFVSLQSAIMSGTTEHALSWPAVHRGALLSLQSRFTLRVPPKESMLRHIRKSSRLIKPLIFCDAGVLLNTIYRDSGAGRRTQCVFYGETLLILRKMTLSCGYGCCVVCEYMCLCVCVLVRLVCSRESER